MRIISGTGRGKRLKAPEGLNTRPTSDKVKESVFNIIQSYIMDSNVLDLFSGSGSLGIEALSRGASHCMFIEKNRDSYKIIKENIKSSGFEDRSELYLNDAYVALDLMGKKGKKYDVVFLDPPYSKEMVPLAIQKLYENDIVDKDGIIISEHDDKEVIPEKVSGFINTRTKKYGRTIICIWKMEDTEQ